MSVLAKLERRYEAPLFFHRRPLEVKAALYQITGLDTGLMIDYFSRFRGPIGSSISSFQILDAISEEPNVVSSTIIFRKRFLPDKENIIISDLVGGSALVYNCHSDKVYNVDFEGGVELLRENKLIPIALSFGEFLTYFFEIS